MRLEAAGVFGSSVGALHDAWPSTSSPVVGETLRSFEVYLATSLALEQWFFVAAPWNDAATSLIARAVLASIAAALVMAMPRSRTGLLLLAGVLAHGIWQSFPGAPNHALLELLCVSAAATYDYRVPQQALALECILGGLLAVTLFAAGIQKVLHGTYTHGTYLAFAIAHSDRFALLVPLLSSDDLGRLRAIQSVYAEGAGPYVLSSPLMLAVANGIYAIELVLAAMLVAPLSRRIAAFATIALICVIQVTAQEAFFGCLAISLASVCSGTRRYGRVAAVCLAVLALSVVGRWSGMTAFEHVN